MSLTKNQYNVGPAENLKLLVVEAKKECEFLVYAHSDDVMPPDFLKSNNALLSKNVVMVSSKIVHVNIKNVRTGRIGYSVDTRFIPKWLLIPLLLHNNLFAAPGAIFRSSSIMDSFLVVGARQTYDWGLALHLSLSGRIARGRSYILYRIHSGQLSSHTSYLNNHIEWHEKVLPQFFSSNEFDSWATNLGTLKKFLTLSTYRFLSWEQGRCQHTNLAQERLAREFQIRYVKSNMASKCEKNLFPENSFKNRKKVVRTRKFNYFTQYTRIVCYPMIRLHKSLLSLLKSYSRRPLD